MSKCELCGEPMLEGEEMFKYHGYSGPCPKPPLSEKMSSTELQKVSITIDDLRELFKVAVTNGTEYAFSKMVLEWAEAASNEITRLRNDVGYYQPDAEKWREANAGEGPTVILKPPISQRFENLVACAHALQDVMDKLRSDAGTDDPFAADPEWVILASHVDSVLETIRNQK